jgi:hypothetical protein
MQEQEKPISQVKILLVDDQRLFSDNLKLMLETLSIVPAYACMGIQNSLLPPGLFL